MLRASFVARPAGTPLSGRPRCARGWWTAFDFARGPPPDWSRASAWAGAPSPARGAHGLRGVPPGPVPHQQNLAFDLCEQLLDERFGVLGLALRIGLGDVRRDTLARRRGRTYRWTRARLRSTAGRWASTSAAAAGSASAGFRLRREWSSLRRPWRLPQRAPARARRSPGRAATFAWDASN